MDDSGSVDDEHELAAGADLSARAVQDLERGLSVPHRGTLKRLAAALALTGDERLALEAAVRRRRQLKSPVPAAGSSNLPLELTSFVGREREQAEVARLLGATRLLTLTGTGGVGKTRLALRVAAAALGSFPDGVWLVELATVTDPALVPQAVASVLRVREQHVRRLMATLADALRTKRLLLVLDNCEHLAEGCAKVASELLRTCPDVVLLATAREPLRIAAELVIGEGTVATHVVHILAKLGLSSRAEVAAWAATHGLLSGEFRKFQALSRRGVILSAAKDPRLLRRSRDADSSPSAQHDMHPRIGPITYGTLY